MKNISAIVLFYNGERFYKNCLNSLKEALTNDSEVILVDNASRDRTIELVKQDFPKFPLFTLKKNRCFSGGMNFGIMKSTGKYLLFLNQDIVIDKDLIKNILNQFESDEKSGIVGCKIYFPGTKKLQHAGGIIHPNGLTNHIGYLEEDTGQYNEIKDVDYVTGAAFGIRRDLMEELGLFDTIFFPGYYEETDLCLRTRKKGFKVIYAPDCVISHFEATTMKFNSFRYLNTYHRNRLKFLFKDFSFKELFFKSFNFELKWLIHKASPAHYAPLFLAYLIVPILLIKKLIKWR